MDKQLQSVLNTILKKIDALDSKVDNLDTKFNTLDAKLDASTAFLNDKIEYEINKLTTLTNQRFDSLEERVAKIESHQKDFITMDTFVSWMDRIYTELHDFRQEMSVIKPQVARNTKRLDKVEEAVLGL